MAWCRPDDKPLCELVLLCFTDAYMYESLGLDELNLLLNATLFRLSSRDIVAIYDYYQFTYQNWMYMS